MLITVLKSKLSYAKITHTDLYYVGSISIAEDIIFEGNDVGECDCDDYCGEVA